MKEITDRMDALPTWVKVVLWMAVSGAVDTVYNALTTGGVTIPNPGVVLVLNVALVAARDLLRALKPKGGTP